MPLQMAPGDAGANALKYAPHRDIAHNFHAFLRAAMQQFDPDNRTEEFDRFLYNRLYIGDHDLGEAIKKFGATIHLFIDGNPPPTLEDCMQQSGYADVPYDVRKVISAAVGEIMIGAIFMGIRDVTQMHHDPTHHAEIAEFVAMGLFVAGRLQGTPQPEPTDLFSEVVDLRARAARWEARDEAYTEERAKLLGKIVRLQEELHKVKVDNE